MRFNNVVSFYFNFNFIELAFSKSLSTVPFLLNNLKLQVQSGQVIGEIPNVNDVI